MSSGQILEGLRITLYEILAVFLPGMLTLYALDGLTALDVPSAPVAMALAAFVIGTATQGLAGWLFARAFIIERLRASAGKSNGDDLARLLLKSELKKVLPNGDHDAVGVTFFSIALSRIGVERNVYDKFIALKDMARGLAFAAGLAGVLLALRLAGWAGSGATPWLQGVGLAMGLVGFVLRYRRFSGVATRVVFNQYVARRLAENVTESRKEEG